MDIATAFVERSRHYLSVEYAGKIRLCMRELPADALWRRTDERSNSIGNILLHLRGNVQQWIVSAVGGAVDDRHRSDEFDARDGSTGEQLLASLEATLRDADAVIASLTAERLADRRTIQGREVTVMEAIYHVVEHFALHTGQVILLTKAIVPGRIQFYEDAGGLAVPLWPSLG